MSQEFHPLPHWLLKHPRRLHWIYRFQHRILLRNHTIAPVFKSWFKKQTLQNEFVSMMDLGCGEGLYCYLALEIIKGFAPKSVEVKLNSLNPNPNRIHGSSILGIDTNKHWVDFLNKQRSAHMDHDTVLTYDSLDLIKNPKYVQEKLPSVNSLVSISVLQYMPNPISELRIWLELLPEKAEVFIYFPIDHHQYTPWYSYLFNKFKNYEQTFNRSKPIGKSVFTKFIEEVSAQEMGEVVHCSYHYHAFAAVGHEQFSFALMLWQNSRHWSLLPIRLLAGIMVFPAWLLSLLGFYIDRLIPLGSPNSVLCILKKNAYIKE